MTWNVTNTTVKNELRVSYSFLPMTYRSLVWPVHKMIPFLLDNCDYGPNPCIMYDYIEYCFGNQGDVMNESYSSTMNAFIMQWVTKVSGHFQIPVQQLMDLYDDDLDTHNSEMRTRYMFKWRTFSHQSGVPFAYVNGVQLVQFPTTANDWMDVLNTVYDSQYRPAKNIKKDL